MKRSRNEVGRWRMLRQSQRRKQRWLERQSCRNRHIIRVCRRLEDQHRRALLFVVAYEW